MPVLPMFMPGVGQQPANFQPPNIQGGMPQVQTGLAPWLRQASSPPPQLPTGGYGSSAPPAQAAPPVQSGGGATGGYAPWYADIMAGREAQNVQGVQAFEDKKAADAAAAAAAEEERQRQLQLANKLRYEEAMRGPGNWNSYTNAAGETSWLRETGGD